MLELDNPAKVLALAMAQCANALPSHSLLAFSAFFALPEVGCQVVLLKKSGDLGCVKPFKSWERLPTSTGDRQISAINSRMGFFLIFSWLQVDLQGRCRLPCLDLMDGCRRACWEQCNIETFTVPGPKQLRGLWVLW